MNKLLLVSALMLGSLFIVFSQNKEQFNEDSTFLQPKSNDTLKILIEQPQRYDNMPIVKPEGSFSMPVEKLDSTVNQTLLIKETLN